MADGKIKISELSEALQINNDAVFPYSQDNGGTDATFGAPMTQIARKVTEGVDFTNLETSNKKIVGAINQTLNNFAEEYDTTETYNTGDPALHDGTLYKCVADNVTGAWDSTKWEEAKAVDFGSGGGGGGGGHTIQDNSGTALTQRTKMQFVGANSIDDSTNGKTVVRVLRSMTKADFDLLTDAEKQGIINVTDVTGGEEDKFQPVIYSTDERVIGVWTDGKPLYQKTVSLTNITIAVSGGYSYDISSWSVDTIVKNPEGFITLSNDTDLRTVPFGVLGNYATDVTSTRSAIQFSRKGGDLTCNRVVFTLVYTKTTDTAGSGQWTPQGVPAHHYSETEQIVGTWIDGSTLYEKTVHIAAFPQSTYTKTDYAHNISNIGTICFWQGIARWSNGSTVNIEHFDISSGTILASPSIQVQIDKTNISIWVGTDRSSLNGDFVIRYTKSST